MSVNTYLNGDLIRVAGIINSQVVQNIQIATVPTASSAYLNKVYQYVGASNESYTHGYFYECVSDGQTPPTYSWVNVPVDDIGNKIFTGTLAAWNELTLEEKIIYSQANLID